MKHSLWYIVLLSLTSSLFYGCARNKSSHNSTNEMCEISLVDEGYENSLSIENPALSGSFSENSDVVSSAELSEDAIRQKQSTQTTATSTSKNTGNGYTSSAAALDMKFGDREFIRTSEMKFKVDDIIKTTYQLEDIALKYGGFVVKSTIRNFYEDSKEINISADSAKLITKNRLESSIIMRVPAGRLDSTLKAIAPLVGRMDYREVVAKDVSLSLLSDKLKQDRENKFNSNVGNVVNSQRNKLNDVVDAENARRNAQERTDAAYISSLSVKDKIEYSTISINIYQKPFIKEEIISRTLAEKEYKIPFIEKLKEAFAFGWNIVVSTFLFLIYIWPFLLIAVVVWFVYKYFKKKRS